MPGLNKEQIKQWFETTKGWDSITVVRAGDIVVEIVKMPPREGKTKKTPPKLALHIKKEGSFRGIYLDRVSQLEDLAKAIGLETVKEALKIVEEINREPVTA